MWYFRVRLVVFLLDLLFRILALYFASDSENVPSDLRTCVYLAGGVSFLGAFLSPLRFVCSKEQVPWECRTPKEKVQTFFDELLALVLLITSFLGCVFYSDGRTTQAAQVSNFFLASALYHLLRDLALGISYLISTEPNSATEAYEKV